jgi:UDP-N-acetylglucosamine diphosphorylase/glucosamine-1-phosphate N-acetyltransferase
MHLCLFEDHPERFEPLTLTRPVFDLRCGATTLAEKQSRAFAHTRLGVVVRPQLRDVVREQSPHVRVNDADWLGAEPVVLVNGRWLPPGGSLTVPRQACLGLVGEEVALAVLSGREVRQLDPEHLSEQLDDWRHTLPCQPAGGRLVGHLWDLVENNPLEIVRDFAGGFAARPRAAASVHVVGPGERLWVDPSARIDPLVVADTTGGPVVVDREAVVHSFTRLEGPCYVGPKSQVLGAKVRAGTTVGPECRVGGEVEASILHGHSNKYHEGFLGHAYVGEWVNLAAGTHNSDLRNDYGEVTVTVGGLPVHTGQTKVGCFLGDHTKTGLGTLLNTGTHVGAFCNLLPAGRYAPKYIPPFAAWWNGALRETFTLDQLLTTAERVMARRGVTLTDAQRGLYTWLHRQTADERRRALRESEQRQLRRSA